MYEFTTAQINPDALQQTEVWYDSKGNCHQIKDMPYSYVKAVIHYLYKKCWKMSPQGTPLMEALKARRNEAVQTYKESLVSA